MGPVGDFLIFVVLFCPGWIEEGSLNGTQFLTPVNPIWGDNLGGNTRKNSSDNLLGIIERDNDFFGGIKNWIFPNEQRSKPS